MQTQRGSRTHGCVWTLQEAEAFEDPGGSKLDLQQRQSHPYALSGTVAKRQFRQHGIYRTPVFLQESATATLE